MVDLKFIYEKLKDNYDVEIADLMDTDLDLWIDCDVLTTKADKGTLYLFNDFDDAVILIENVDRTARCNLYPSSTSEAIEHVTDFLQDNVQYTMTPYKM